MTTPHKGRPIPSDYVPGGPPLDEAELERVSAALERDESLCSFLGRWRIVQGVKGGHRWSTEDLMTSWVTINELKARGDTAVERHLDLGTGLASVLQMVAWKLYDQSPPPLHLGVEAQEVSVRMARKSVALNGIASRVEIVRSDFRNYDFGTRRFDLVTGTPPYFKTKVTVVPSKTQDGKKKRRAKTEDETEEEEDDGSGTKRARNLDASLKEEEEEEEEKLIVKPLEGRLPRSSQSAPARFEFRGGFDDYVARAGELVDRSRPDRALVVICEGNLDHKNLTARARRAAEVAKLNLRRTYVFHGRESKPALFCVHAFDLAGVVVEGEGSYDSTSSSSPLEVIAIRSAVDSRRTEKYQTICEEMGIPRYVESDAPR